MANDLTGDYDVAVQLSLDAVNRVTAALHSVKRFPHSLSMAIDDRPNRTLPTVVAGVVDLNGSAVVNPKVIENGVLASVASGWGVLTQDVVDNLDPVVNPLGGLVNPGPEPVETEYSYVYGVAQAQLGAPSMKLPKGHSDQAEIHTPAMIRYFANTRDPKTDSLSPFLRGEIVTTFAVKSVTSKAGANIVVDLAGPSGNVHFDSARSEVALDAADKKAIDLALSKVLKHGFEPSSTPRPDNVLAMDFRGYPSESAIGMLMNVTTHNDPSPDSVRNVFLHSDDQFALALNGDGFTDQFSSAVNSAIDPMRVENIDATVTINYWIGSYTFHIYTRITVGTATVQLTNTPNPAGVPGRGQIVLTIPVTVNFGWEGKPFFVSDPTDFGFTIVQAFTLTLDGTQVGLQTVGAVQINIPGSVPSDESDPARSRATTLFNNLWSSEKSRINQQVNGALSAGGLESFLHSLMNPAGGKGAKVDADLAYTSFEINSSGIVLHGSLSVPPWPSAHIDFDNDPSSPPGTHGYQALNSWIPGGTIQDYLWTFGTHAVNDSNRFVVQDAPLFTFSTCLTLTGQRISAAGLVFYEPVIAGLCKTQSAVSAKLPPGAALPSGMQRPLVALVRPAAAPASGLEVVGHISPWTPKELGAATANVVVHFPDSRSATQLDVLPSALVQSGRTDTAAAILAVLTRDQLSLAKPVDGLMYADEATAWEQLLGVQHRPSTVLLDPSGNTAWRQDGPADLGALAGALRDNLVTGAEIYPKFPSSPLQTGERSPNFEFEFPAGQQLTLRKLAGKPVVLVFFKRASAPSVETIRNLHGLLRQGVGPAVIVAIDDGDDGQFARGLAAGEEGDIIVVPDPDRQISLAYRITVWPTIVFLDAEGLVRDVRFGLLSQKDVQLPVGSKPIPAGAVGKET